MIWAEHILAAAANANCRAAFNRLRKQLSFQEKIANWQATRDGTKEAQTALIDVEVKE